ncbi:hypothetical protein [Bacillus massilinigeriensis]|uniref:hypothetical protein n=1 Tax=Bacillus massilionigeriensis TaxID=1805475 RepID=UPI00096B3CE0|nr:hypothetical protein [Bacillus massilionigeriensis]
MVKPVGFDQKVMLHHLDCAANETRKLTRKEMYEALDFYLRDDIKGAKSRKNAITMLMKIWYLIQDDQMELRNRVLKEFPEYSREERLLLHWGMTLLAYPFFKDVVLEMGKLFRLQDEVPSMVVGKKIKELYGDRRRVEVATSAVLMSIRQWGAVEMLKNRSYQLPRKVQITNPDLIPFIAEIVLRTSEVHAIPLELIHNHPLFFPFGFDVSATALKNSPALRVDRQGVEMLTVELSS